MTGTIKTYIKSLGFGGFGQGSNTSEVDVDVDANKIVRIRPLHVDKVYDKSYLHPWKIEKNGHSVEAPMKMEIPPFSIVYKNRLYSHRRVPFPMKRVDWEPGGDSDKINSENRGVSKYVRISWDEATQIVADEIKRITEKYNKYSILHQGDGHGEEKVLHSAHGCPGALLKVYNNGFTYQTRNPDSWEGWYWGSKFVWGDTGVGLLSNANMVEDVTESCQMLLHWGCDAETTPWGWGTQVASKLCYFFTDIGIKQVFISPDLNYSAAVHADKWIPVYPNTDAALQLAIAHTWLENGWYDEEYVDTHSVGFDWEVYHIYGEDDGIEKTPEWAEDICGVPARIIKALAKQWYLHATSIAHNNGGSFIRSAFSTEPARLEALLLGMQGLGKPGRGTLRLANWGMMGVPDECGLPMSECYPNPEAAYQGFFSGDPRVYDLRQSFIPKTLIPEAILGDYTLEHPLTWHGTGLLGWPRSDSLVEYQFPSEASEGERIHMIWSDAPCWTTCWNGGNRFIKAVRSPEIETYIVQHPWLENDCMYADLILPVTSKAEEEDIAEDFYNGYYSMMYYEGKCVEPANESKSDWEICCEVAKKLGCYDEYVRGRTPEEWLKRGFDKSGIDDGTTWEQLKEQQLWVSPVREDWKSVPHGLSKFAEDPEKNPISTPSGKLEFYSTMIANTFPDDKERPPYAQWVEESDEVHERLSCERAKKYPFLLISNHPRWRVHAQLDDSQWMREIPTCKVTGPDGYQYEPVWINPVDAEKAGIKDGDIVRVFNERGWVMGGAIVTERIAHNTVYQDHGARCDPIVPGESDRGGANNLIAPHRCASKNTVAENTSGFLVGIEKVDVFELAREYPEAFSRPYAQGYGVEVENWLA